MSLRLPKTYGGKFIPASELAVAELAKSNGSITHVQDGHLVRVSASANDWDMRTPWHGRELTSWTLRKSLWARGIVVSFYVALAPSNVRLPAFTLTLVDTTTPEEVKTAAETYMMLLNLVRKD